MIPHHNELQTRFAKRGLVIVGVTDEPEKLVEKYVADNKVTYPIVIEQGFKSSRELGIGGFPSAVLVDPKGIVVWSGHPGALGEAEIEKALAGAKPPGVSLPAALKPLEKLLEKHEFGRAREAAKAVLAAKPDDETLQAAQAIVAEIEADAKALADGAAADITAKDYFDANSKLERLRKEFPGVPGAETADAKWRELQADGEIRKAIKAGEQFHKGQELEQAQDYDKAYAMYRAVTRTAPGSRAAEKALQRMNEFEQKGMFGFAADCPGCRDLGYACPKHKKKAPK